MKDLSFFTTGDGSCLAYRFDGSEEKLVLMLSNSIGTTLQMWDGQIEELSKHFRVLRYDQRGHGRSDAPARSYSLDRMGRDVIELLDALSISRVHFLGISFGGLIGQWLGIHAPERVDRLILLRSLKPRLLNTLLFWSDSDQHCNEKSTVEGPSGLLMKRR